MVQEAKLRYVVAQLFQVLRYRPLDHGFDSPELAKLWPWVNSACNRSKYQEYFLGVNTASAYG